MEENPEIKCFIYTCLERNSVFKKGFNPVGFSSNSKKEAPIGVPGTSERSVLTLTGEGINTHTHRYPHVRVLERAFAR